MGRFDEGLADNDFDTTDGSLMLSASGTELPGCPDGFMQVRFHVSWTLTRLCRQKTPTVTEKGDKEVQKERRANDKIILRSFFFFVHSSS